MILPVHERLRERLLTTLQQVYQLPSDALPQLPIEYPPKRELGDLATPVAFELARRLRKAPRAIPSTRPSPAASSCAIALGAFRSRRASSKAIGVARSPRSRVGAYSIGRAIGGSAGI